MAIRYRQFALAEVEKAGKIFAATYNDLLLQRGLKPYLEPSDPDAWVKAWSWHRKSLFEHLTLTGYASWFVEDGDRILGYARSVERQGVLQLADYFVLPGAQGQGLGKGLLERAFPSQYKGHRIVIATTNEAALTRYLKSGVYPLCPVLEFYRKASPAEEAAGLEVKPLCADSAVLSVVNRIDREILGYERELDHQWLLKDRKGYLYLREGEPVGYGYVGSWAGPFAMRETSDYPAVLAHAETQMAESGGELMLAVPLVNRKAVDYLLSRGFQMNTQFVMLFLADRLSPQLDRYIISMPVFFN
jgi:GNAT superfamily N-acetyltransferase